MKLHKSGKIQKLYQRTMAMVLSVAMVLSLVVVATPTAQAASWMTGYLDKLVSWGVMRGDISGNLNENKTITRAEFVTMLNRAYGYEGMGENPFKDVPSTAWFADDINIAYNTGYFAGTSETTASPDRGLSREEATILLAKNMMLQSGQGEVLNFTDGRRISDWSRGMVQSASNAGVISGYPDGSFRPQNKITRGEVAVMLVNAIGTPIQKPGDYTMGSVYGNVTITSSGVTLRNTIIAGDLYLTGGVGLGNVLLENVTVLGKIITSGAGESNEGDSSIILRNVTAKGMLVDSLNDQFVTIRTEGDTKIDKTKVHTSAYLEDVTAADLGLMYIELDGEPNITLQLAGNIKKVMNITPDSRLALAQGTAKEITMDERATNSVLTIEGGASVKNLNLDVASTVNGKGDIDHLNVNAPGSKVEMLPDTITIRPGISADIAGESMDSAAAAESSADPKLLAGYPAAQKVAPTSAEAVFSTNKKGTVHWAITALSDGSVSEKDLITPPAYNKKILKNGTVEMASSKKETAVKIPGLTSDGSYYLSAILVDARGKHSPVKVTAFTTPDDSTPKFANGYPYMSKITNTSGQVAVMPSKSCQLFWAVMPKGSTAPTVKDFKAGAVSGNLGYGNMDVKKNIVSVFTANSQTLKELETYDLYLVLVDADGGKDSGVKKLSFTTVDRTPPVFLTEPTVNSIKETSVGLISSLNENGTIFWVVVKQGEEYPKPMSGQTTKPTLDSDTAKLQVANGMNALKSGKVPATASKDATITVSGLEGQAAYDLYYLAQDKAGNYSDTVKMITIHTLDSKPPEITQEFTKTSDAEGKEPMPDTDIKIIFSEGVQDEGGEIFVELYNTSRDTTKPQSDRDAAKLRLEQLLRQDFKLYDASTFPHTQIGGKSPTNPSAAWIDYSNVEIKMEDGKTVFRFKNGTNLHLTSGGTYYFEIFNIADTSNNKNMIKPNPQKLPEFTTVFAKVNLQNQGISVVPQKTGQPVRVDMSFQMHPMSTGSVDASVYYDVFLWSNSIIKFDLYARTVDKDGQTHTTEDAMLKQAKEAPDSNGWVCLGNVSLTPDTDGKESVGESALRTVNPKGAFPQLNSMNEGWTYEYAISLTQVGKLTNPDTWSDRVTIGVTVPAGPENSLSNLSTLINQKTWDEYLNIGLGKGGVKSIGDPSKFEIFKQFTDTQVPKFASTYPTFEPGDAFVTMHLQLDRPGTIYYVLAPMQGKDGRYSPSLETRDDTNQEVKPKPESNGLPAMPPTSGGPDVVYPNLSTPVNLDIYQPSFSTDRIKFGTQALQTGIADVRVEGLEAETIYYAYFVLKGNSQNLSEVYCLQFTTTNVKTPEVILDENSPKVNVTTTTPADLNWILYAYDQQFPMLKKEFSTYLKDPTDQTWQKYFPNLATTQPTVLDALLTSITGSNRSVFDEYANETAYKEVLGRIKGEITGGVEYAGRGELGLKENTPVPVDCTKYMTAETQYYFLAAARNTQGSIYGFKAVENVHMPDQQPPEFKSVETWTNVFAANPTPDGNMTYNVPMLTWEKNPRQYAYKGTITLEFDEPVYQLIVDTGNKKTLIKLDEQGMEKAIGTSGGTLKIKVEQVGSVIRLSFEGATDRASIFFFNQGTISDAYSNAHPSGKRLKLTFDPTRTSKDDDPTVVLPVAQPGWVATWG